MRCPYCNSEDLQVIITKADNQKDSIKRRRECNKCKSRFSTEEKIKKELILVKKKDGSIERFEEDKLEKSIRLACRKTNLNEDAISELITDVFNKVNCLREQEISSYLIGDIVQEEIKSFDPIAYIKYTIVYKEIKDIDELQDEIDLIK